MEITTDKNFLYMDSYDPIMPMAKLDKSSSFFKGAIDLKCCFDLIFGCSIDVQD